MDRTSLTSLVNQPREIVLEEHGVRIRWREMTIAEILNWRENSRSWPPVRYYEESMWVYVRHEK